MKISRRSLLGSALAGAAPAFLSQPSRAAGVSSSEIVVGTHLDLSGPVSIAMPPIRNAMQMRFDEANEAGGIHGRKLRLVIEDSASQAPQGVRAVDKLLRKDEIFAMLSPFGSAPTIATIKKTNEAGVMTFAPYAASSLVRKAAGDSPLLFTTNLQYDTTTEAGVRWAVSKFGSRKVGLIYQEGAFGDLVMKGVNDALTAKGLKLVVSAGFRAGDIDLSAQVARMRSAGVDLIVGATTTRETIGMASEVRKLGWSDVKVLTCSPGRGGLTPSIGKAAVEGVYGIGTWLITPIARAKGATKTWIESYRKRFNGEPDDAAMLFYDYASWFMQGIEAAGKDLTTDRLVKALQASSYKGLSSYDTQRFKNNHIDPEWIRIEQIENGQWEARSELIDPAKTTL